MRFATWKEIDDVNAMWKIPAERMKMKRVHIVPLSKQAIGILNFLKEITYINDDSFIFPSIKTNKRPILHENGFPSHIIEMQLAHAETNSVKASYNHAQYLNDRVSMMQWWADYLYSLKSAH